MLGDAGKTVGTGRRNARRTGGGNDPEHTSAARGGAADELEKRVVERLRAVADNRHGTGTLMWVKIDDGFYDHPKIIAAGLEAAGLLVGLMCWSARHLTDGVVTRDIARSVAGERRRGDKLVARLLQNGCLELDESGAYLIHDWSDYQPSSAEVKASRAASTERVRRHRERHRNAVPNAVTDSAVTPPRPVPSRRDKAFDFDVSNDGSEGNGRSQAIEKPENPNGHTEQPKLSKGKNLEPGDEVRAIEARVKKAKGRKA